MEEKQKVQVVFEFDRSEYDAYLFLMNQKKTKEVEQIWNTMSGEPVVADIDLFEEDSQSVKLMMISLAILSVEKKGKDDMAQEVTNFARFYALFNKLPYQGDREEFKKQIVLQYTWNRTDSLKEMTAKEYEVCCTALEKLSGQDEWRQKLREELRRKRSVCLKLMQQLGIDTTDWNRVNEFCNNPRIAGKPFVQISTAELEQLAIKLRAIQRKGGLTDK